MKPLKILLTSLFILLTINNLQSQVLIWEETFDTYSDGATSTVGWYSNCISCGGSANLSTSSGDFLANNLDGRGELIINTFNVPFFDNVMIEVDVRKEGDFEGCYSGCGYNCFDYISLTTTIDGSVTTHTDPTNGGSCSNSETDGFSGFIGMGDLGDPADAGTYSFTYQSHVMPITSNMSATIGFKNWAAGEYYYIEAIRIYGVVPLNININDQEGVVLEDTIDTQKPKFVKNGNLKIVDVDNESHNELKIFTALGKMVYSVDNIDNNHEVKELPHGYYLYKFSTRKDGVIDYYTGKFLVW